MRSDPRRIAAVALAVVLIIGVGFGIITSARDAIAPDAVTVSGLIGSEKDPFFHDARVIAALKRGGFIVDVTTAGSRQIAERDLSQEDFAFPGGVPAAEKIRTDHPGSKVFIPFYTPMAIATWQPIVDILTTAGVIHTSGDLTTLDVDAYIQLVDENKRWKDLPGNTAYPVNKSVLLTSTDVRKSNSAAMYLSLASYVANGDNIVQNDTNAIAIADRLSPIFLRQGFQGSSSEEPFDDYLVQGMGKSPMVMIYESQYIQRAAAADGTITPEMRLVYPDPTILSKHTFVGLTDDGSRLGDFLTTDPEIRTLATEYGFRTTDTAAFNALVKAHALPVPANILDVIDPPTYETLEAMITRLESLYDGTVTLPSSPPASQSPTP